MDSSKLKRTECLKTSFDALWIKNMKAGDSMVNLLDMLYPPIIEDLQQKHVLEVVSFYDLKFAVTRV